MMTFCLFGIATVCIIFLFSLFSFFILCTYTEYPYQPYLGAKTLSLLAAGCVAMFCV